MQQIYRRTLMLKCDFNKKVFWIYAANLQENTRAKVQFQ